ncbi:MAG: hypothetical protein HY763_09730 [Planctomycetes bacterium]|nr:hypothetical protein [Planctomycetota bacterium]
MDTLEQKIQKLSAPLDWRIDKGGCTYLRRRTGGPAGHTVYVTLGTPRDTSIPQHVPTHKRMNRATIEVGDTDTLNPHEIVRRVLAAQGEYDLDAGRPNAWVVPDYPIDHRGDCQTLVRYVGKVIRMSGVPGAFEQVRVFATLEAPAIPQLAVEGDPSFAGLCGPFISHPTHPDWRLFLEDGNGHANCYEAAARFTVGGTTTFYPGGIPGAAFASATEVLNSFAALSWFEDVNGVWVMRERVFVYP